MKNAAASRERPNAKGEATRELILLAAERLFAEQGIMTVPLRDIALAAGQRNKFAVQYHFGGREELLAEITDYRSQASDQARTAMIDALGGRAPGVDEIMAAFVWPLAGHLEEGNHYLAFLSRYIVERGSYRGFESTQASARVTLLHGLARRALPSFSQPLFEERWTTAITSAVHAMARYQTLMQLSSLPAPIGLLVSDLVEVVAAGLGAPMRPQPGAAQDRMPTGLPDQVEIEGGAAH